MSSRDRRCASIMLILYNFRYNWSYVQVVRSVLCWLLVKYLELKGNWSQVCIYNSTSHSTLVAIPQSWDQIQFYVVEADEWQVIRPVMRSRTLLCGFAIGPGSHVKLQVDQYFGNFKLVKCHGLPNCLSFCVSVVCVCVCTRALVCVLKMCLWEKGGWGWEGRGEKGVRDGQTREWAHKCYSILLKHSRWSQCAVAACILHTTTENRHRPRPNSLVHFLFAKCALEYFNISQEMDADTDSCGHSLSTV